MKKKKKAIKRKKTIRAKKNVRQKKSVSRSLGMRLAPVNPQFTNWISHGAVRGSQAGGKVLGHIPSPVDLSHLKGKEILASDTLPPDFDLRKQGRVSPVRNQENILTCWAFASLSSLESCLLPEEEFDFSENNMKNLTSIDCPEGFDRGCFDGGNHFMAAAYLARWSGPVLEEKDPYNTSDCNCEEFVVSKHLESIYFIPPRIMPYPDTNVKMAVMNCGAVYSTIYWDNECYNSGNASYFYQGNGDIFPNHAICIVGWDDNYSRDNFNDLPMDNGAYIAKNSWGTEFGDEGYFYISYYDIWIASQNAVFNQASDPKKYSMIYEYDPLGWTASIGTGDESSTIAWGANIFTASSDQDLMAVSSYAAQVGTDYELYIYLNPPPDKLRNGNLVLSMNGTLWEPGYFTLELSSPISLQTGQRFAVVLRYNTPNYGYPIPVEYPLTYYSSKAKAAPGQGYVSLDGITFDDLHLLMKNTSVCIKVFSK